MKTIKSFLFVMFMLLASNVMANPVLGEVNESEPVEGAVTGSETLMIYLSNFYETPGHKEAVAQVLQFGGALLPVGTSLLLNCHMIFQKIYLSF